VIFLFKIGRLTVNRVLDFHDDYGAISSAPTNQYQSQRGHVPIGLHMIKHSTDGPLFFEGDRVLRVVAYDVSSTSAVVHADGLALQLPFMQVSESMGNHDSKIVDAASVD
jgi:hypothetical protein